jgi:hypothetical protein|nr:MAG TPA: hypothetical protein [Caudoviricetes sp.]
MKTIKIGNKEYKYDCNAYTYILFKKVFNRSIFDDLRVLQEYLIKQAIILNDIKQKVPNITEKELESNITRLMMEDNIEKFVESATRIVYILIKEYNDIDEYEDWLRTVPPLKINDDWIVEVAEFAVNCFC